MSLLFKPMPGYVICKLIPGEKEKDGLVLPEEEPSWQATIEDVGPHETWWKRLVRYPKDLKKGDVILLKNTRGIVQDDMLAVRIDEIRCKIK